MPDIIGLDALANQYGSMEVGAGEAAEPVVTRRVLNARDLPKSMVGLPAVTIDPGDSEEVQIDVQRDMRPDRLVLGPTSSLQLFFKVRDIKVGTISLNASDVAVPAECFCTEAVGTSIRATMTADTSIGIQLYLANEGGGESPSWPVRGAFFGPSAKPGSGVGGNAPAIVGAADAAEDASAGVLDAKELPQSFVGIPDTLSPGQNILHTINCKVTRNIRPDRMILPGIVADLYDVRDMRVGTTSLNASRNPVFGGSFSPLSFGSRLRATVTATPALGISLDVIARTAAAGTRFCGAFFGPSTLPSG